MLTLHLTASPRPRTYGEAYLAQVLAESTADLADVEACATAFLEALGCEPECDWLSVGTRAADLRAEAHQADATAGAVTDLATVAFLIAAALWGVRLMGGGA